MERLRKLHWHEVTPHLPHTAAPSVGFRRLGLTKDPHARLILGFEPRADPPHGLPSSGADGSVHLRGVHPPQLGSQQCLHAEISGDSLPLNCIRVITACIVAEFPFMEMRCAALPHLHCVGVFLS